jgi:hypothetical protein
MRRRPDKVKQLRREAQNLNEVVAEQSASQKLIAA